MSRVVPLLAGFLLTLMVAEPVAGTTTLVEEQRAGTSSDAQLAIADHVLLVMS